MIRVIDLDQAISPADNTIGTALFDALRLTNHQSRQGQEGNTPLPFPFQVSNSRFSCIGVLSDYILQIAAQGHFNRRNVILRYINEFRHSTSHAAAPAFLRFKHRLDCLAEALISLLHLLQELQFALPAL